MTDKVQKIKEWICKEQEGLMDAQGNFEYPEHEGAYHILCDLDAYIDSLQEEPVSEDLNEAVTRIIKETSKIPNLSEYEALYHCAVEGAQWQKDQLISKAVDGLVICDEVLTGGYKDIVFSFPKDLEVDDHVKMIIIKED